MMPRARIKIKSGTGLRTFGTRTTNCSFERTVDGAIIFTAVVRIGFEASSETERTSALKLYKSSDLFART